jgi:hypothetical protein
MKTVLLVSWAGLLFTGIVCGSKLFVGDWLLIEPSPFFLWFPAWWFSFGLFTAVFTMACAGCKKDKKREYKTLAWISILSFLGSLLSGRFVLEVYLAQTAIDRPPIDYVIMFPWSLYVFTLFLIVFIVSTTTILLKTKTIKQIKE